MGVGKSKKKVVLNNQEIFLLQTKKVVVQKNLININVIQNACPCGT